MKTSTFLLSSVCSSISLLISPPIAAATWYVDGEVALSGDGSSWETAFQEIQEGIDRASYGDTVIVAEETYYENIHFDGKNIIILRSKDPSDAEVVAKTVIDGNQSGSVVTFSGSEYGRSILSGFTIRNGKAAYGGGIWGNGAQATIRNNVITGNFAEYGGGLAYCDGIIQGNVITYNTANSGGGLAFCDGTIRSNIIACNSASRGGGLGNCEATICNCIIWGNIGGQLWMSSVPTYSCIENWTGGGEGNIALNPRFIDAENGDYRLQSWSPCIDAGDPASEFSDEPQPNGGRINMGAYGNTLQAASESPDTDGDGLPDNWEMHWFGELGPSAADDPDGDRIPNIAEYTYAWDPTAAAETLVENLTRELCYEGIQPALWESDDGDEIVVHTGVYRESISFGGKNAVLRSTDPSDPDVIARTIIDAGKRGPVVTFDGIEEETCVLSGFTIRNGGTGIVGGTEGTHSHAAIQNNVITDNDGSGIRDCDGTIQDNVITGNSPAGGLVDCHGTIQGNVIAENSNGSSGGGLDSCDGTIQNNTIYANSAGDRGGGLAYCNGAIQNNIVYANSAANGGGLAGCDGTIRNCIVWGNIGGQLWRCSVPTCSCIQNWMGGGKGNIALNPHFVHAENGDFHLRSWSPCIDAGDPFSDFSKEPEPDGGRVNMGAYGNTPEATSKSPDTDADGLPDDWELHWFEGLQEGAISDPDGDHIYNGTEYSYGWIPTESAETLVHNVSKGEGGTWYQTIQPALCEAGDGNEIVVYPGVHGENIDFGGKNVILRSTDPSDADVVANTILEGGESGSVVSFSGAEDATCVLSGFTIRNGRAGTAGGVCGGSWENHTHATIQNNVISGNSATGGAGGGLAYCDGTIQNNTISGNSAEEEGGGLAYCDGTVQSNLITGNSAYYGGGLYWCHGRIQNNTIYANSAGSGGGLYDCSGTIQNNTIYANSARGGGGLCDCGGTIQNNIIYANSAGDDGGGLHACDGTILNSTIAQNSAGQKGGGLSECSGTVHNCIIWGNAAPHDAVLYTSSQPTFSCIENWTGAGDGNIAFNPRFVDAENRDFHLRPWSPCIDAGDPFSDFSNEPEPNGGRVNMGAYGNTPEAACKSPDDDSDGLPDDWELLCFGDLGQSADEDPDGDRIPNITEYNYAWDPKAASETLVENLTNGSHYQTIRAALSECDGGDEIIVYPSIYEENIHFGGKNVILRSTDPSDGPVIANTVIDGSQFGSVVTFSATEDESCVLTGFTIRNGKAPYGGGICGGTEEIRTHATIRDNVITGNTATRGGGVYGCHGIVQNNTIAANTAEKGGGGLAYCDGTVQNNVIAGNSAYDGGGLYGCDGEMWNNTVTGNSARRGGGLYVCDGTIQSNVISGNSAELYGGGLAFCDAVIQNNVIAANSAGSYGGGLYGCGKSIRNNTVHGNSAGEQGGGLYECGGTLQNCIIWGNLAPRGAQIFPGPENSDLTTYSCIQDWTGGGETNILWHPHFVDPDAGDYHLRSWSPCIDAGDPASDFSNEPEPNGGRIDMGAYGNTPEAAYKSPDSDDDGLPDDWEVEFFGDLSPGVSDDPDGDLVSNMEEYHRGLNPTSPTASWYVDESVVSPGDGTSWETAFKTVQEAINAAPAGSVISVAEGIYVENIQFRGENIALMSKDPFDPTVVANTILDGGQSGPVVTFSGGKDEICILAGFTICNGSAATGGGICGNGTNATIRNNSITGNYAHYGGGVHGCDGTIENNGILGNSAQYGAGLAECGGIIFNNSITRNSADMYGGGLARCHATIRNNLISRNSAAMYGGGLYRCDGAIQNNTITANFADYRGGALDSCSAITQNNIISGNWATWLGGALYACERTLQNNTIVANSAGYAGGALDSCFGTVRNCIIWGNRAVYGSQLYDSSEPTYSCIQDWASSGEGNIAEDPQFADQHNGDFRLSSSSPCIDAGDNDAPHLPDTDIAGTHRIIYGGRSLTVDMGAYEYYINELGPGPGADETTLTWSSLADKTYSIFYTGDLLTWHLAVDAFPSLGDTTTSWTDDGSLTGLPPSLLPRRFYRILENP